MTDLSPSFRFVLAALATWRITHLLSKEDGPADLLFRLRGRLGSSFAAQLMDCFFCLSLWVAAPLAWLVAPRLVDWILTWPALSGATCLLERILPQAHPSVVIRELPTEGDAPHVLLRPEARQPEDEHVTPRHR